MTQDEQKKAAAKAAAQAVGGLLVESDVIGFGTGSTVRYFVDAIAESGIRFGGAVSSSDATTAQLESHGILVIDAATVANVRIYVDGADEVDPAFNLIKGGGGALTREKIVAAMAQSFICIVDQSKRVSKLGAFPLPIEVIPMAQTLVASEIIKLGGTATLRESFVTDNGNVILDVKELDLEHPLSMEHHINNIVGVVCNGIFASHRPQHLIVGDANRVLQLEQGESNS